MTRFKAKPAKLQPSVKETLRQNMNGSSNVEQPEVERSDDGAVQNQKLLKISNHGEVVQGIIWSEIIGRPKCCKWQRPR